MEITKTKKDNIILYVALQNFLLPKLKKCHITTHQKFVIVVASTYNNSTAAEVVCPVYIYVLK